MTELQQTIQDLDSHQTEAATPAAAPLALFSPVSLELPADPESLEFSEFLQQLRPLYEHRQVFNFMVCDQLALRGLPPNGMNVLKAGRWGATSAVVADVRAWYANLATRLSADQAKIPEAIKRSANGLLEQMWTLVLGAFEAPATARIQELEDSLQRAQSELEQSRTATDEARTALLELQAEKGRVEDALRGQLTLAADDIARFRTEIAKLQDSIAEAAMQHERDRREDQRRHQDLLAAAEGVHREEVQRHLEDLAKSQAAIQRERDRNEEQSRSHAMTIDGFRQDVRDALRRADAAQAQAAQEKARADQKVDELSQAELRAARAEMQASDLRNAQSALQAEVTAFRDEIKTLQQRCATAEASLSTARASRSRKGDESTPKT